MSALQQDIYNQIKFRTKHLQHGWAYFTLDEVLRHDKVVPAWVYENPQLKKDRWTGLLDKEQKEIYERDIVDWSPVGLGVVRWIACGFAHDQEKQRSPIGVNHLHPNYSKEYEVIGNIYENPNLLPIQPKK